MNMNQTSLKSFANACHCINISDINYTYYMKSNSLCQTTLVTARCHIAFYL